MNGSSYTKWYCQRLKSHPMTTNISSAVVFMIIGDFAAQEIELNTERVALPKLNERLRDSETDGCTLSFRRYGTLSPNIFAVQGALQSRRTDIQPQEEDNVLLTAMEQLRIKAKMARIILESELASIDLFRCSTMAFWSGFIATPAFILLYRVFDKFLPASSRLAIVARVGFTTLMSIPVNAAFFCYGTFVHHVTEWMGLLREWRYEVPDATLRHVLRHVPLDLDMCWSAARLKMEAELSRTVMLSAVTWVPINAINFTMVPPYLRPLTLTICSMFWNCYLSLAQHRDANLQ